ncbi:MAG: hypothetical protein ACJ77Z_13530 [Thermoleophilaceae bacterium]
MLLGLALAAAVAGGNLAVTASPHPRVYHYVRIRATGQVGDAGRLFVYRNRGVGCANSADEEVALGTSKVVPLHPPLAVEGSFDFTTLYLPSRFGEREWVCSYLYARTCDAAGAHCGPATGLPPDAGFSRTRLDVAFALPAGWRASPRQGRALQLAAMAGSRHRMRASGVCAGRAWRMPVVQVGRNGSFSASAGGMAVSGRFMGRVTGTGAVRARVSGPECPRRAIRLGGRAPLPARR